MPKELSGQVLEAYNWALVKCFEVGLAMACLSVIGSAAIEWKSVKKDKAKDMGNGKVDGEKGKGKEKEGENDGAEKV